MVLFILSVRRDLLFTTVILLGMEVSWHRFRMAQVIKVELYMEGQNRKVIHIPMSWNFHRQELCCGQRGCRCRI